MKKLSLVLSLLLWSLHSIYSQEVEKSIVFLSNVYSKNDFNEQTFKQYEEIINSSDKEIISVFLGGYHAQENDIAVNYLEDLKNENSFFAFIPGYEEWVKDLYNPEKKIVELNSSISDILEEDSYLLPVGGCPGPYEFELDDNTVLILFDDQWLISDYEVPKIDKGCKYPRKLDFLLELKQTILQNADKRIILASTNPLESSGPKGGNFKFKHHIFPFSIDAPKRYIPLPIFGTLYLAYRKLLGNPDDLQNIKNRYLSKYLRDILSDSLDLVYVAANEKHLDSREVDGISQITVGSISGSSYTSKDEYKFNSTSNGFTKMDYNDDGSLKLSFYTAEGIVYSEDIFGPSPKKKNYQEKSGLSNLPTHVSALADSSLVKPGKKRAGLIGLNYREEWATTISHVPVFDWGKEHGGLHIVKKGGGMQTRSLRLENPDEKQYVLRSIKKYPENAIPPEIRGTIYAELVNDQISASHPYAAYAIPKLADAANVYHTNPRLVFLPDDDRLGDYKPDFANGLFLYEERPAHERKDVKSFGSPRDIESTLDIVEKTQKSGKHQIDQQWVLKSRLFDMWIGDWDRHDDQWRWAEFKIDDDHKFYRPIPRDRDQAFFYSDGLILNLASRKWGIPKFQGFDHEIRDVNGLSFNARYFDRYFLTEPGLKDWLATADTLQKVLTDEVIESGIKDLPKEIYEINGETIISKLKSRREDLDEYAEKFHKFLSKSVNVLGTNKANYFEVIRKEDGHTLVTVTEVGKNSRKTKYELYQREFDPDITKEIRLYGLKGKDEFKISGEGKKGIKVRIIGGGGKDVIEDVSKVRGISKKTIVYDKKKSTELEKSGETRNKLSNSDEVNNYNRNEFKYDKLMPFVFLNYNPDDGVFLGGGPVFITHGFRKDPFRSSHKLLANIAPKSANYNVSYKGIFTDVLGKIDAQVEALLAVPSFSTFYYGFGNNSILSKDRLEEDNQYYRVRFDTEFLRLSLNANSKNQKHQFSFGPNYLRANIEREVNEDEEDDPRFIVDLSNDSLTPDFIEDFRFGGAHLEYTWDTRDDARIPGRGMHFYLASTYRHDLINSKQNSIQVEGFESIYLTLSQRFKTVLALRAGGAAIFGDYPFFIAPTIGGLQTLRGFRRNRFSGDYSFYQNSELRIKLFTLQSEFLISDIGILALHDIGRVWTDNSTPLQNIYTAEEIANFSSEDKWHQGIGFGLWLAPFNMAVVSADYSFNNNDDSSLFLRLGFLF